MTVGNFDGLHLGHRRLLAQVVANQRKLGDGVTCVYTFDPHPRRYFNPQFEHVYLQDRESWRLQLEEDWKIDYLVQENFTKEFADTPASEFLQKYWQDLNLKTLVVGEDFRFGHRRVGDVERLKKWCLDKSVELFLIPPVEVQGVRVSTTLIRDCLVHGDLVSAEKYLGRHFNIEGQVEKGQQKGRLLGFPTLNVIDEKATLLRRGVYVSWVKYGDTKWPAITNVGIRPTLHSESAVVIESHVLEGLNQLLYGEQIEVEFISFIREEKKFGSLDELKNQIATDATKAREHFRL